MLLGGSSEAKPAAAVKGPLASLLDFACVRCMCGGLLPTNNWWCAPGYLDHFAKKTSWYTIIYHTSTQRFAWPLYPLQRLSVGNSNGVSFLAGPRGRLATNVAQGIVKGFFRRISLVLDPGSSS